MADISYNKTTWVNGSTALNAANLNNIEMGVDNATKAINNKVDKVAGKGLSTHDFNDHYKNAIDNLQDVEANPTGTGTADLTKLKVGTTIYNIPSGSDVSVFDLTPYFNGSDNIGTEGYNALKDYLANNKCPMVRLDLGGQMYVFNVSVYDENSLICSSVTEDTGNIIAQQLRIDNSGKVTVTSAQIDPVEGVGEQGTFNLIRLNIGGVIYYIPRLEAYDLAINNNTDAPVPLKILTYATTTDGRSLLEVHNGNYGIGHSEVACVIGIVYKQAPSKHSGYTDLFTTKDGTFAILTANAEYSVSSSGGSGGSSSGDLTFPTTPPTSQLIPSITTSNTQQNLTVGDGLTIENGVLKATGGGGSAGSSGWVNILELNDTDATAVGNAINKLYKSADDSTEIPLTTPVDFSKPYQYIRYIWDGTEVVQTIGRYMSLLGTKLYMSMDKLSYFSTFEADNKSLGLTLAVTEENGVSKGTIYVARTATM